MEERRKLVSIYQVKGLPISKAVIMAGISRGSYYYRPRHGKAGRKPSVDHQLVNGTTALHEQMVEVIKELSLRV